MIDAHTLKALVHFGLITQEQADAYWEQEKYEHQRLNDFILDWWTQWDARNPWWKRLWVIHVGSRSSQLREMRADWQEHQRALDT